MAAMAGGLAQEVIAPFGCEIQQAVDDGVEVGFGTRVAGAVLDGISGVDPGVIDVIDWLWEKL